MNGFKKVNISVLKLTAEWQGVLTELCENDEISFP